VEHCARDAGVWAGRNADKRQIVRIEIQTETDRVLVTQRIKLDAHHDLLPALSDDVSHANGSRLRLQIEDRRLRIEGRRLKAEDQRSKTEERSLKTVYCFRLRPSILDPRSSILDPRSAILDSVKLERGAVGPPAGVIGSSPAT